MIKISVIIPVYNSEQYLDECLNSIVDQTLKDIEIIVINDCSSDCSASIIEKYANSDERFVVISNPTNLGASNSRNKGIEIAKGEYIQFVDSDDYLDCDSLECIYNKLSKNDADMGFIRVREFDECGENIVGIKNDYSHIYTGDELLHEMTQKRDFYLYLCGAIYKGTMLKDNEVRFENYVIGEGGMFILKNLINAKRVLVVGEVFYNYRKNALSITKSKDAKNLTIYGQFSQYVEMFKVYISKKDGKGVKTFLDYQLIKITKSLKGLDRKAKNDFEKLLNDNVEKLFYESIFGEETSYGMSISKETLLKIEAGYPVIIFGAGVATLDVIQMIHRLNANVIAIAVSKADKNLKFMYGHSVRVIDELVEYKKSAVILVGANRRYKNEIRELLEKLDFEHVEFLDIVI